MMNIRSSWFCFTKLSDSRALLSWCFMAVASSSAFTTEAASLEKMRVKKDASEKLFVFTEGGQLYFPYDNNSACINQPVSVTLNRFGGQFNYIPSNPSPKPSSAELMYGITMSSEGIEFKDLHPQNDQLTFEVKTLNPEGKGDGVECYQGLYRLVQSYGLALPLDLMKPGVDPAQYDRCPLKFWGRSLSSQGIQRLASNPGRFLEVDNTFGGQTKSSSAKDALGAGGMDLSQAVWIDAETGFAPVEYELKSRDASLLVIVNDDLGPVPLKQPIKIQGNQKIAVVGFTKAYFETSFGTDGVADLDVSPVKIDVSSSAFSQESRAAFECADETQCHFENVQLSVVDDHFGEGIQYQVIKAYNNLCRVVASTFDITVNDNLLALYRPLDSEPESGRLRSVSNTFIGNPGQTLASHLDSECQTQAKCGSHPMCNPKLQDCAAQSEYKYTSTVLCTH